MRRAEMPVAQALRFTVDPHMGIANRFVELGADPLAPDVFVTCADGGAPSYLIDHAPANWYNCSNASGAAYTREASIWSTLGELLERYCASIYDRSSMRRTSARQLGAAVIPMQEMILQRAFDCADEHDWCAGRNMLTGAIAYAPAQLLYLSHEWAEDMLMQTVSTGLACHSDPDRAALSALLEVIERDGFAAAWTLGMALPRLVLGDADLARLSDQTRRALANENLSLALYALPNAFGVANVFAFATHREYGFGAVGGAAHLCPYQAIEKAVIEALHGWVGFTLTGTRRGADLTQEDIQTPHDHALYYMDRARWAQLDWFLKDGPSLTLDALQAGKRLEGWWGLADSLSRAGYSAYLFDLTTEDIAELGLQIVRVVVPGLQPLSFGKTLPPEDRRRLEKCAVFWGYSMPGHLNVQPHPFP